MKRTGGGSPICLRLDASKHMGEWRATSMFLPFGIAEHWSNSSAAVK